MKEEFFIKQFQSKYIGDDAAVIEFGKNVIKNKKSIVSYEVGQRNRKGIKEVIASDSFFEDIHFKRKWFDFDEISYKASLVNISDIIVMNAKPKYAILNVGFPKTLKLSEIKKLADGFKKAAKEFNYEIIGGDTIKNEKIAISITLIGETQNPIYRKAKVNEFVAYTGNIGEVRKDLIRALRYNKIDKNSKLKKPIIRNEFFFEASKYITSACDISDGLFKEMERISKISKIGYNFLKRIDKFDGCSGEEYEILFTFKKKYLGIIKNIAIKTKTPINIFAVTKRGAFRSICKENHF